MAASGPDSDAGRRDSPAGARGAGAGSAPAAPAALDVAEVIRRLRILRQPATLFGEGPKERAIRLKEAEATLVVEENYAEGGTQVNVLLEIRREEEAAARQRASRAAAQGKGAGGGGGEGGDGEAGEAGGGDGGGAGEGPSEPAGVVGAEPGAVDPQTDLAAAFAAAAAKVRAERREAEVSSEEAVASYVERLCAEWGQQLEARPSSVKASPAGVQATHQYKASVKAFQPLLLQLRGDGAPLPGDVLSALWLIVGAMKGRDYLRAMDLYLKLSIGNAAWPIGVTQVGIHTRSAREKISHVANSSSQAHAMNDEVTRKYIHAFKRLITFAQTAYPTDPSKSIDFNGSCSAGRGGAGSDLAALRAAERRGDAPEHLLLPAPRSVLEPSGRGVAVPPKWHQILSRAGVKPRAEETVAKAPGDAAGKPPA